jgi:predicted permease
MRPLLPLLPLFDDMQQAWRSLTRSRAVTVTAVLVLALGSGATAAVVSLLDELRLRPLALPRAEQLYFLQTNAGDRPNVSFSWPEFNDLRAATPAGASLMAFGSLNVVLAGSGETRHAWGERVSGGYFPALGARTALGRALTPADDVPGAPRVLVLSHAAWRRAFGGDPAVVGRTLRLNRVPYEVVGVAEYRFTGLTRGFQPEYWIPLATAAEASGEPDALTTRRSRWLQLCARVGDGVPVTSVAARLQAEEIAIGRDGRDDRTRAGVMETVSARGGDDTMVADAARLAGVLAALVAVLLVLAVSNLAGLLLARASTRRRELGVRMALGAPRSRLVRQLLAESLLVSLLGGLVGVAIAGPIVHALVGFLPAGWMPLAIEPRLDLRVLGVLAGVLCLSAVGVGVAPAFEAGRTDVQSALRDDAGAGWWPGRRVTLRGALVVAQVALSFVLLVGAGLFARSLWREMTLPTGFDPRGRFALTLDLGGLEHERAVYESYGRALLEHVQALPGVESATLAQVVQPSRGGNRMSYDAGDLGIPGVGEIEFDVNTVGPRYFATLGVPLVAGREFTLDEGIAASPPRVVALNRSLARRLFGDADPIGRTVQLDGPRQPAATVVAVVPDLPLRNRRDAGAPCAYLPGPFVQTPTPILLVHARDGVQPLGMADRVARELSPDVATADPRSLARMLGDGLAAARMTAVLLLAFALVALSLAALGLYGLLAHAVSRRRREIGVRMALGADGAGIVRFVAGGGLKLVLLGLSLGALAAALLGRTVAGLLYRVPAFDPTSWALALGALLACAALAAGLPARVAARVQPAEALRAD